MKPYRIARTVEIGCLLAFLSASAASAGATAIDATAEATRLRDHVASASPDVPAGDPTRSKSSVYFDRGSIVLASDALATISENAERLKADPEMVVTLVGYVEDVGSTSYSVALAQRRTSVVMDVLTGMGISPRQIRSTVFSHEAADDLPCQTELCKTSYRRVEFAYAKPR